MNRRTWLVVAAALLMTTVAVSALIFSRRTDGAAAAKGPPVVVLMDSTHPERIYDEATRKAAKNISATTQGVMQLFNDYGR